MGKGKKGGDAWRTKPVKGINGYLLTASDGWIDILKAISWPRHGTFMLSREEVRFSVSYPIL